MILGGDEMSPIYLRVAGWLEDGILNGTFREDERIYSQYQLAEMFNINPATAAKALNQLADEGAVYKKRGLGMFVSRDSRQKIQQKRCGGVFEEKIRGLVDEAVKIGYGQEKLIAEIKRLFEESSGMEKDVKT